MGATARSGFSLIATELAWGSMQSVGTLNFMADQNYRLGVLLNNFVTSGHSRSEGFFFGSNAT